MDIWLLKKKDRLPSDDNPWLDQWDKATEAVVIAESEASARELVAAEDRGFVAGFSKEEALGAWTNERYSTCEKLVAGEVQRVVVMHIQYG